jgi:hypothetical protein
MPVNNVTVTESFGAGNSVDWVFVAGGTLIDDANAAILTPIVRGNNMPGGTGLLSAVLPASDNYGTGELLWTCFIRADGYPLIEVHDFPVNFSSGSTQTLFAILKAAGWTPPSM